MKRKRRGALCAVIGLCFVATALASDVEFEFPAWLRLGSRIPKKIDRERKGDSDVVFLIESNFFYASYPICSNGMQVKVLAYDSHKRRRIRGVLTEDGACETLEGIAPGDRFGDVKGRVPQAPRAHFGWGHFWELPSGWIAVFHEGSFTEEKITDDSIIVSLVAYGAEQELRELSLVKRSGVPSVCRLDLP